MNLTELELMRARWRRALATMALDTTRRPDFGTASLSQRVADKTARAVILSADPELDAIRFDDDWWRWLEEHKAVDVNGRTLKTCGEIALSVALARVSCP